MVRIEVTWKYYRENSKRAYRVVRKAIQVGRKKRRYWDLSEKFEDDYNHFRQTNWAYLEMDFDTKQTEFIKILFKNKKISRATFYRYKSLMESAERWKEFQLEALTQLSHLLKMIFTFSALNLDNP